ncbi:MAG: ATP-binding cassette domain-containing protein, partial [Chloroflexota bacterium]|nr:ATP-binding cassette domain-containing protein [Chloroflexota bacterium]
MSPLQGLLSYLGRHKVALALYGLAQLAAVVLALLAPYVLRQVIDAITAGTTGGQLLRFGGIMVLLAAGNGAARFISRYGVMRISRHIEYQLRNDLFAHLQKLDASFYQQARTGDLMARLTNDLSAVRMLLGPGIQNLSSTAMTLTVTLALMLTISLRLALYSGILLPLVTLVYVVFKWEIMRRFTALQEQFSTLSAQAQENFSGVRVVKAFAQEELQIEEFRRVNREYADRGIRLAKVQSVLWPAMQLIVGLAFAMVILLGGRDVVAGRLTLGQYVQFNAYLSLLVWPMIALGWTAQLYQEGMASMSRLIELFDTRPGIVGGDARPPQADGRVEFRDVTFAYDGMPVLRNVDLSIPARTSLGIVGPTGSGKTALVQLLPRLFDVREGQVLVDGLDVRGWPLGLLRARIGYVPQETFLFSDTLAGNVALGIDGSSVPEEELAVAVADAARLSRLSNDLSDMPEGLQTVIG